MSLATRFGTHKVSRPEEFRCRDCECRCTHSPDGQREYGHAHDCPLRTGETGRARVMPPVERGPEARDRSLSTDSTPDRVGTPDTRGVDA